METHLANVASRRKRSGSSSETGNRSARKPIRLKLGLR
jgi:hypothetical protein